MKIDFKEYRLIYILLATIILFSLFALTSCQSIDIEQLGIEPNENGIVCGKVDVNGFFTNSQASYRYIEAGESVELTAELIRQTCPGF